jgi:hypothetical protein
MSLNAAARAADIGVERADTDIGVPAITVPARALDEGLGVEPIGWLEETPDRFTVQVASAPGAADGGSTVRRDWRDPVLAARALQMGALLVAAEKFAVPADHRRVLHGLSCSVGPAVVRPPEPRDGQVARSVTLHMVSSDAVVRRGQLVSLRFQADLAVDGEVLGNGAIRFGFLSPAVARFLRAQPPAVARSGPGLVGSPDDAPDDGIPLSFDGVTVDHVPGILLLAACARASRYAHGSERTRLVAAQVEFPRFADPAAPCTIRLRPMAGEDGRPNDDGGPVRRTAGVSIHQEHGEVLTGRLESWAG